MKPRKGPSSSIMRLVVGVVVLGLLASGSTAWVFRARTDGPVPIHLAPTLTTLIAFALTALAEIASVTLRHGEEQEELTFYEAAVVADVLVLPPALALGVALGGLVVASFVKRRGLLKSVFNLGAHATGAATLVGTVSVVARPGSGLTTGVVVAVLVGTLAFALVNLILLSGVLHASIGVPVRETLREGWRLSAIIAIGTCGIGSVAVGLLQTTPALVPFTLMPAAALAYAYRAAAQETQERERSTRLLALSQVLAGRLVADDLLTGFLGLLRETFRVDTARVVLEGDELHGGTVVLADEAGVSLGPLTAVDAALLALTSDTAELLDDNLPEGWGRTMLAPLDAEGSRLGVLALVCPPSSQPVLVGRDLAVLTPLVSALGVALRGAEHLAHLTEGTGKLQTVVQHSSDGILVVDHERRVQVWNPAMTALTGIGSELALGRALGTLVQTWDEHGEAVEPCDAGWALLTPETPRATVELQLERSDGEQRWVRMSHAAVFEAGTIVQDVVLVYDVTRERQVERMKADFIATVSHELRTPVTPIKGYVDLLRRRGDDFSPEKRREFLDTVADRVNHLARLVEDLLLASQVASPATAVRKGHGDLAQLTRRAVDDFAGSAQRIHVDLPERAAPIACDPTRVVQVIGNLVSNALKYSPDDAPVFIRMTFDDGRGQGPDGAGAPTATVEVRDEGSGIPADQLERVFEKFHRVGDPLRMTTSGTGLGLYIARQLTEAMAGRLELTSTLGIGSTFRFTMPVSAPSAASPGPEERIGFGPFAGTQLPRPRRTLRPVVQVPALPSQAQSPQAQSPQAQSSQALSSQAQPGSVAPSSQAD